MNLNYTGSSGNDIAYPRIAPAPGHGIQRPLEKPARRPPGPCAEGEDRNRVSQILLEPEDLTGAETTDIIGCGKPPVRAFLPLKKGMNSQQVIQSAPSSSDKPSFIAALFPKKVQGQFRISEVLLFGVTENPVRRVLVQTAPVVQGIHIPQDPIRPETGGFNGYEPRIGGGDEPFFPRLRREPPAFFRSGPFTPCKNESFHTASSPRLFRRLVIVYFKKIMNKLGINPIVQEAAGVFVQAGKQAFLVGGAVRDLLRGKAAKDWDLATDARPEEVIRLFRRVIPTGIKHGTVTVLFKGLSLEVTTFRTEAGYSDGRRPDQVSYAAAIEEDLSRRDFTMNAVALELPSLRMADPFGGQGDIKRHLIRCVGDPSERFAEDGLRPLRALRFAAQLGFDIDGPTLEAIPAALPVTAKVSAERIRDEFDKIAASPKPSAAFLPMEQTGLMKLILSELAQCRGIEQKGCHRFDVLDHSLLACDYAAAQGFSQRVRLAALFHDLGKPLTRKEGEDRAWTFYRHEEKSERLTRRIMSRLRYPNGVIEETAHLVAEHMFHYDPAWGDAAVRRFIVRAGEEYLEDLYALRRADAYAAAGEEPPPDALLPLRDRVEAVLAQGRAFSLKDLAVAGADLMAVGVKSGPRMGIILKELLETVLDDPGQNTKETLLEIARNLNNR